MFTTVTAEEATQRLPELLALVDRGERVVITSSGRPIAELVPAGMAPTVPRQASLDVRAALFVGTESMNDISLPEPRI